MATTTDYYQLLGVSRAATDEQIRSAYRKLARQFHPDVNGEPNAAEQFKRITEAYEVLTDPQRRQRYDMFGSATGGFTDFGIGDLFETFFGGDLRRRESRGPMRGADLRMEIEVDLLDAVQGRERVITVPRLETCERCRGSGAEPGSTISTCGTCGGRGEVRQVQQSVFGRFVNVSTCPRCGGAGKTVDKLCTRCRESYRPTPPQLAEAGFPEESWDQVNELFRPTGCGSCAKTGFRGRIGLYEVMPVSEEIERLVVDRASSEEIRRSAERDGMIVLRRDGLEKVRNGITSIEEVLRVVV